MGLDNRRIRLAHYQGKTVIINFCATWCPPCKEEMPALDALYRNQPNHDVVVLSINASENVNTVRRFVEAGKFSLPVALDPLGPASLQDQAISLPTSYFVDGQGIIREKVTGAMTPDQMVAKLAATRASLGKPVPTPVSLFEMAGADNGRVVATVGTDQITLGDVNHRLDLQLALEELRTGQVLDVSSNQGRDELARRRTQVLESLVDERLLMRAATESGMSEPNADAINEVGFEPGGGRRVIG